MSYFKTCPHCGANLDPGEVCDCRESPRDQLKEAISGLTEAECAVLLQAWKLHMAHPEFSNRECVEKAARGATNTTDGRVEKVLVGSVSASNITENGGKVK